MAWNPVGNIRGPEGPEGPQGEQGIPGTATGGALPVVTGEIINGQPIFVHADDGSLIYSEVA